MEGTKEPIEGAPVVEAARTAHGLRLLKQAGVLGRMLDRETDRASLVERVCVQLTEHMGCPGAWIALVDAPGGCASVVKCSGAPSGFHALQQALQAGGLPEGLLEVVRRGPGIHRLRTPLWGPACPIESTSGSVAVAACLAVEDTMFGVLAFEAPVRWIEEAFYREILDHVVEDVARALDRLRMEDRFKSVDERYRALFSSSRDGIVFMDGVGRIQDANQAFLEMMDYSLDALRALPGFGVLVKRNGLDEEQEALRIERLMRQGGAGLTERGMIRANGEVFAAELQEYAVFDHKGLVAWRWCVVRDISERKREEARRREMDRRYRVLTEQFPNGALFLFDRDIRYLAAGGMAFKAIGLDPAEVVGKKAEDVFPELWAIIRPQVEKTWSGEASRYELTYRGRVFFTQIVPIPDEDGVFSQGLAVVLDITESARAADERAELQRQLAHGQRLESVGRLAGGIAHEFNNMLQVVVGYTDQALHDDTASPSLREDLEKIMSAARRSASLTRRLLAFARKQEAQPQSLMMDETIDSMLSMLRPLIGESIELKWRPGGVREPIFMDATQLDTIVVNLATNARDAIAREGAIVITTSEEALPEAVHLSHGSLPPGRYAVLTVADSGTGIDDANKARIFEPFFTTKEVGEGSGLGLAMVYGIVSQNKGAIDVESVPGHGTKFRIYLPLISRPDRKSVEQPPGDAPGEALPPGGRETVLLVEDEEMVLDLTRQMLRQLGYTVMATTLPERAIEWARTHKGPIDLLLADMVMPRMNGVALGRSILRFRPKIACMFMSGYANRTIPPAALCISKPFSLQQLAHTVREALCPNRARDGSVS